MVPTYVASSVPITPDTLPTTKCDDARGVQTLWDHSTKKVTPVQMHCTCWARKWITTMLSTNHCMGCWTGWRVPTHTPGPSFKSILKNSVISFFSAGIKRRTELLCAHGIDLNRQICPSPSPNYDELMNRLFRSRYFRVQCTLFNRVISTHSFAKK